MKGKILITGALLCLAGSIVSMSLVCFPKGDGGDLAVLPDEIQDLGLLRQGVKATAQFQLRNRASVAVSLLDVSTSCGCTSLDLSSKELPPGQSATLTLAFNTGERRGVCSIRGLAVYEKVGDDRRYAIPFRLQARIDPDYSVEPEDLKFGGDLPIVQYLTLRPRHIPRLKVTRVACDKTFLDARVVPAEVPKEKVIEVTFRPENYYPDAGLAHVSVFTDSKRQPLLQIPVDVVLPSGATNPR